ncbi:MAG: hypothetical protein Fur0014_02760 [Rubrivivax sp.]
MQVSNFFAEQVIPSAPVELDPALWAEVTGGTPKNTWSTTPTSTPKNTWSSTNDNADT